MAIKCAEFLKLMDEDGPLNAGEAAAHAASCASCREAYRRWKAIRGELKSLKEEPAPPFLHTRVMIHVRTAAPAQTSRGGFFTWARVPWAGPLLAAALLILLGGYGLLMVVAPQKRAADEGAARRSEEVRKLKEGLPPLTGASKTTVEKQYDDILGRADADKKAAEKPKEVVAKDEVQLHYSGLKKDAEKAQKDEEDKSREEIKTRNADLAAPAAPVPAPVYAPEPAAQPPAPRPAKGAATIQSNTQTVTPFREAAAPSPPRSQAKETAPTQANQNAAPAGNLAQAQSPVESQVQTENTLAARDRRLREGAQSAGKAGAGAVACVLEREDGSRTPVTLALSQAPPQGHSWGIVVRDDGSVAGADRHELPGTLLEALSALRLPPGRYTLKRA